MAWYLTRTDNPRERYELKGVTVIGRLPDCTITLAHGSVSRRQCRLTVSPDGQRVHVEDLASSNGVYIEDTKIVSNRLVELKADDRLGIGLPVNYGYPGLEKMHHYIYKLIKEPKSDPDTELESKPIIIDLTIDDVAIKEEIMLDLDEPMTIIDSDDEENNNDHSCQVEPPVAIPRVVKNNKVEVHKKLIYLPEITTPVLHRRRSMKQENKKLIKLSNKDKKKSEPVDGLKNLIKKGKIESLSTQNKTGKKVLDKKINRKDFKNTSPTEIKQKRRSKLQEIAEKQALVNAHKVSKSKPIEKTSIAAKVTVKNRGTLLLENMEDTSIPAKRKNVVAFDETVSSDDQAIFSKILTWDPLRLEPHFESLSVRLDKEMPTTFVNYEEYSRVLDGFIHYEMWKNLTDSYSKNKSKPTMKFKTLHDISSRVINQIVKIRIGPAHIDTTTQLNIPKYGDVVIIECESESLNNHCLAVVKTSTLKNKRIFVLDILLNLNYPFLQMPIHTNINVTLLYNINYEMRALYSIHHFSQSPLRDVIVCPVSRISKPITASTSIACSEYLDEDQLYVTKKCLSSLQSKEASLEIIHGPPGTGKTTLLIWTALEYLAKNSLCGNKVLLCAQTNLYADNLLRKFLDIKGRYFKQLTKLKIIRGGRRDAIQEWARSMCSQNIHFQENPSTSLQSNDTFTQQDEANVYIDCDVIVTTLLWCSKLKMLKNKIVLCLIDDASLANEAEILCPLSLNVNNLILTGDNCQVTKTTLSKRCHNMGFSRSLFHRLVLVMNSWKSKSVLTLHNQHRMYPEIMHWPNKFYFDGKLKPKKTSAGMLLLAQYRVFLMPNKFKHEQNYQSTAICMARLAWALYNILQKRKWNMSIIILSQNSATVNKIGSYLEQITMKSYRKLQMNVESFDNFQGEESDIVIIAPLISPTNKDFESLFKIGLVSAKNTMVLCCDGDVLKSNASGRDLISDATERQIIYNIPEHMCITPNVEELNKDYTYINNVFKQCVY